MRATSEILAYKPEIKVVMLTVCETDDTVFRAFELGVTNYLLKNIPASAILSAVKHPEKIRQGQRAGGERVLHELHIPEILAQRKGSLPVRRSAE
ncbi:hypothetical protein ACFSR7_17270 [Cohnella sp. GCM10020058]|uniref:hypothetical protein n=1 Tax=Cohnella sp. GCM10020058 TaxID=3317330 RepID=UPI00363AB400